MSIVVNGVTIPTKKGSIIVNGVQVEKVICNGTTVWTPVTPQNNVEATSDNILKYFNFTGDSITEKVIPSLPKIYASLWYQRSANQTTLNVTIQLKPDIGYTSATIKCKRFTFLQTAGNDREAMTHSCAGGASVSQNPDSISNGSTFDIILPSASASISFSMYVHTDGWTEHWYTASGFDITSFNLA